MKSTVKIYLLCDNYPQSQDRLIQIIRDYYGPMTELQIVAFAHMEKPTIEKLSANGGSIAALQKYLDRHYQAESGRLQKGRLAP